MRKVLIISYTFPPSPGIGGRRWAKFAKYLSDNNEVFVLTTKDNSEKVSPWNKDILELENENKVVRIKRGAVKYIETTPRTIIRKIFYRATLLWIKTFNKGNPYDRGTLIKSAILQEAISLVKKHKIKNIIISAPPFGYLVELLNIKKQFPEVNMIADFRDPWTNNKTAFGFDVLASKRFLFEKEQEKKVIDGYDYIISVSEQMTNHFRALLDDDNQSKCLTVANGFDPEDNGINNITDNYSDKLKFIFTGTLYNKTAYVYNNLLDYLIHLKKNDENLYKQLIFEFYGDVPKDFEQKANRVETVKIGGKIDMSEVYKKISESHICMLFLTRDLNYSRSTKFYEYLNLGKPIAVFGEKGETATYIEQNKVGYAMDERGIAESFAKIVKDWKLDMLPDVGKISITDFSIKVISSQLDQILVD